MLRGIARRCSRRLDAEYSGAQGSDDPVGRARIREAFLDAARVAHAEGGAPRLESLHSFRTNPNLEPEEHRILEHAAGWYGELYGSREVTTYLHDCDRPTESPGRGVRVGGWVDLTVVSHDGVKELRQLDLWGGAPPAGGDPLELPSVWIAVLRLSQWTGDEPLLISWADLVNGDQCERLVHVASELDQFCARFDSELAALRERIATPTATPGRDCAMCRHVWRCPAHPDGVNVAATRGDLRPGVIRLSPTSYDAWTRCARAWRNQYLLDLPASDGGGSPDHGQLVHHLLRFTHENGSCHDSAHVDAVLDGHAASARLRAEVARHTQRCPSGAEAVGHELELARFHGRPWPPFMATARLDAVWVHDGLLDARDYKTGNLWSPRVADDPRALIQAFVLAPIAAERRLRLRLRYEYLASEVDEDPEPWELDDVEVAQVEEQLRAEVEAIRARHDWAGVADEATCRHCRYRSICPDSASRAEPSWPVVSSGVSDNVMDDNLMDDNVVDKDAVRDTPTPLAAGDRSRA
jgi:hypothetical protein